MNVTNLNRGSLEFTSNAFLVTDGPGSTTALVDAGNTDSVIDKIKDRVDGIDKVILTHTHPDHVGALDKIKEVFDLEAWGYDTENPHVDHPLKEGDAVEMGGVEFHVIHTPGHKDDHVCLYGDGVIFAGDLVFAGGSFGRTDLAEGDRETLKSSIKKLLDEVDEFEEMHAGHQKSLDRNVKEQIELSLRNAESF
ncbi:MAG: MBL fold metallo-hydrolase [Halobacteria archaeon]